MAPTQDENTVQSPAVKVASTEQQKPHVKVRLITGKESFRMHFFHEPSILQVWATSPYYQVLQHSPPEHVLSPLKTRNRIRTYPLLAGFHGRRIWVNERTYLLAVLPSHHDAEDGEADGWDRNNGTYAVLDDIILCCLQLSLQWVNFLHMVAKHFGWSLM